ncbi:hypothetical protein GYMLUDRAFT_60027 [Collybiopsis luxurians FD-317 M1]|uniref:Uncharacterized protein n=1 Tax=Collybiopsis luxurians FD-317 M1 TaxID=944289 RepID=A0A0D0CUD3_9AGAR|nr:hypothetical protein GYMLUDRAFT_60027 [Collybiopsis luxurians FD-317 M1]
MHISLSLFFLGLVIFFVPINYTLSCVVGWMTLAVYALHLCHLFPILDPQCPYQTPFSDFILIFSAKIHTIAVQTRLVISRSLGKITSFHSFPEDESDSTVPDEWAIKDFLSLKDLEKNAIDSIRHKLSVDALHWLYNLSSDISVQNLVLQAIGGLPAAASQVVQTVFKYKDIAQVHEHLLRSCTSDSKYPHSRQVIPQLHTTAERLCRLFVFFPDHGLPWPISFSLLRDYKDNQFEATYYSAQGLWSLSTTEEYRTYIISHTDLLHHPLVWVRITQRAHEIGTFAAHEYSSKLSASFCRALLPAVWGSIPSTYTSFSEMTPIHVALRLHLPKDICLYLLKMLPPFDFPKLSLNCRVVAAALEFALDHISASPSDFSSIHWDIIEYVLKELRDLAEMNPKEHTEFFNFMVDFVSRLIKTTGFCDHPLRSERLIERRDSILKVYWAALTAQPEVCIQSSVSTDKSSFVALRRATQGTLRQLQLDVNCTQLSKHMASSANKVFDILSIALRTGSVDAFQIVVDLNCLELFAKYHRPSQGVKMVSSYVAGLKTLPPDASREEYINYLYEPRNLNFAILSIFERWPYVHSEDGRVTDLILLRPDSLTWDECRQWLKLVLEWAMHNSLEKNGNVVFLRAYLIEFASGSDNTGVESDVKNLTAGSVYLEPIKNGILKLQGAIQSIDQFFPEAGRKEYIKSLKLEDMAVAVSRSSSSSKDRVEDNASPIEIPRTFKKKDKSAEYV